MELGEMRQTPSSHTAAICAVALQCKFFLRRLTRVKRAVPRDSDLSHRPFLVLSKQADLGDYVDMTDKGGVFWVGGNEVMRKSVCKQEQSRHILSQGVSLCCHLSFLVTDSMTLLLLSRRPSPVF